MPGKKVGYRFPSGSKNPQFNKGWAFTTKAGYIRIWSGPNRGKYVHRLQAERLYQGPLPWAVQIHHMDGIKWHNCFCNLLFLDIYLHSAVTASTRSRHSDGSFQLSISEISKREELLNKYPVIVPDWMLTELPYSQVPDWVTREELWAAEVENKKDQASSDL